ncbi:SDR family NAD(P)-dependent oxidoreductase [Micromonospora halotolerans]
MNDSTALVTGANQGIGKEIARQLAAAGLIVYLGSRDPERGQRAVDEIGGNARLLTLDVTDGQSVAEATRQVENLDILVNNAGISVDLNPVTETDVDAFRRTYETNVFGVVAVTNAFLPALRRSARPRIVNLSSGTGSLGWSTGPQPQFPATGSLAAYRSSKTALNALTVFYAQALAGDEPQLARSNWHCCPTTAPPANSSPGTEPACRGDHHSRNLLNLGVIASESALRLPRQSRHTLLPRSGRRSSGGHPDLPRTVFPIMTER